MSFKTVFMTVGVGQDDTEIERAAAICRELDAHLVLLVLGIAPPPPASPYGVVSNDIWAGEIRDGQSAAQERADAVMARLQGISSTVVSQYIDRGTVATLAARFARYADLTLITAQSPTAELMQGAAAVDAVLIDPVPSFDGHGPEPGHDLAAYLGRHGIATTVHRLPKEGKDVGEVLLRTAADVGAELIVMGGFGHSRLRERIFGGTTTTMMKDAAVPVLMAH